MKGDPLPGEHHVLRYVGGSKIDGDTVAPAGFKASSPTPSVNWLECVQGTVEEQIERVRRLVRIQVKPTARFAQLNVDVIRSLAPELDVLEDPLPAAEGYDAAPCHAEIVGIKDEVVYSALAESVMALHPARA